MAYKKTITRGVGDRIAERRKELGLTQEELAIKLGYKSKASINKIEVGKNDMPLSKVKEFADALQTSPAVLMGWVNQEASKKNSVIVDATIRMKKSEAYLDAVVALSVFTDEQLRGITQMLKTMR